MHKVSLAIAVLGSAFSALAQTCSGAPAAQVFSNRAEFGASFYYNIGSHIFDLNTQVPITISGARTWLYDSGVGNPATPNQVGNTSVVQVYTCPTSRLGNESNAPSNPGSPWTLLGTGTMTVADSNVGNGESPTVFSPPLALPAGAYGVAFVYNAPTAGLNPGPLHCLGVSPNPAVPYTDPFMTMSNDGIVATAWVGPGTASPNLRILYTPAANSAQFVPFGDGCYFRPQAFYEIFPPSPAAPDIANTSMTFLNVGPSYLVIPGAATYVTPTSTSLTAGPTGSTSSANWDDALSVPILLPFAFNYPGGSTNEITISSNGAVLLANVVNNSYDVCGAIYASIAPFRDGPPRISPFHHDLDPSPTGGGNIYYDVDPSNQFVRITWAAIPEWTPVGPGPLNTFQVTLNSNGNVDIYLGSIGNTGAGGSGNRAITGFTPGLGSRLPAMQDLSATIPFQAGDGEIPPVMTMSARPVLGSTPNVVTMNIKPGTIFQVFVAGLTSLAPTSLAPFGMPGCFQHINPFTAYLTGIGGNGEFTVPFTIPNHPSYQGMQMFFQSAPLTSGLNAAGIITSNGLCVKLGL